jgi:hypothetical protein
VAQQQKLTRDQKRELAREMARAEREKRLKSQARNRILIRVGATVGVIALLAAVGGGIWLATRPAGPGPVNMASDGVVFQGVDGEATVVETRALESGENPIPTDPSDFDDVVRIVTYLDFGCPYCAQFETTNAAQIEELVADGVATLEVHPINLLKNAFLGDRYSARSANASACVAAYEPSKFLDVSAAFFAQQPAESGNGFTNREIVDLVKGAGVTESRVEGCITGEEFKDWVEAATLRALTGPLPNTKEARVTGTPTILVNGERYVGSLTNPAEFRAFVESFRTDSGTGDDSAEE